LIDRDAEEVEGVKDPVEHPGPAGIEGGKGGRKLMDMRVEVLEMGLLVESRSVPWVDQQGVEWAWPVHRAWRARKEGKDAYGERPDLSRIAISSSSVSLWEMEDSVLTPSSGWGARGRVRIVMLGKGSLLKGS
jgi:hypothetical protein